MDPLVVGRPCHPSFGVEFHHPSRGPLSGYDRGSIVAYFIVQSIVYHFTVAWQAYEFSYLIRSGTLSVRLLRPFDPSHYIVVGNIAFKLINLVLADPDLDGDGPFLSGP